MDETSRMPGVEGRWGLSVTEAADRLGISRAHAYRMVAAGELPSVRLGHRTIVPVGRLRQLLDDLPRPVDHGQDPDRSGSPEAVNGGGTEGASVSVRFGGLTGDDRC